MTLPLLVLGLPLGAQQWDLPETRHLVERAIERRSVLNADTALLKYRSRARGTVLYLARVDETEAQVPHLLRADELEVEVYWQAPRRSKQYIRSWRRMDLFPLELTYHRDHLGIVTDDFGEAIRLGDGDEVRDVVHPLSARGRAEYEFRRTDSLVLRSGDGQTVVHVVEVRPHDPGQAAVVGTLFLDGQTAALVRFRFGFTRTAYLQPTLERITVDLESALHEQRYWVPFRQRVEVRRRTAWLDFPLQTTIRGVWEVDDYDFDPAFSEALFVGDRYGGLREPDATGPTDALNDRVGEIARTEQREAGDLRRELEALVGSRFVRPDPPRRLAFGGLSDLLHANRVRGLVLGLGWSFRPSSGPVEVRPWAQYGFADQRLVGGVRLVLGSPLRGLEFSASRRVRDLSDWPVVSPLLNSVLAQERAQDFGDYYLADRTETMVHGVLAGGWSAEAGLALERTMSLPTKAQSAAGSHRPNPPLGAGTIGSVRMVLERRAENTRPGRGSVRLTAEGGLGDHDYVRLVAEGRTGFEVGAGTLRLTARAGALLGEVPSNRVFVLGGRGTLTGEGFRAFGGRRMALARLEWRIPLFLASFGGRGLQDRAFAAPFLAAGWTDGVPGPGNRAKTQGIRPVLGVATDLLFQTMRIELGWAPRAGRVGLVFDASPGWWPIL